MNNLRVQELIKVRQTLSPDDPQVQNIWCELTSILSESLFETLQFLQDCSSDEVYWLSEVFEDVAAELKNIEFINCLISLQDKHQSIDIQNDIDFAKKAMQL